jgi:hypothetical protein
LIFGQSFEFFIDFLNAEPASSPVSGEFFIMKKIVVSAVQTASFRIFFPPKHSQKFARRL